MNTGSINALLAERKVSCPCCGERFMALLDLSAGERSYVEDCPVCCRALEFALRREADDGFALDLRSAD